jgi:hypothetical protein
MTRAFHSLAEEDGFTLYAATLHGGAQFRARVHGWAEIRWDKNMTLSFDNDLPRDRRSWSGAMSATCRYFLTDIGLL